MIDMIDKRLRQASTTYYIPFGGVLVMLVGNFQQLTTVSDATMYSGECLLLQYIEHVVVLQ